MGISTTFAVSDKMRDCGDTLDAIQFDALNLTSIFLYIDRYAMPGISISMSGMVISSFIRILVATITKAVATRMVNKGKIGAIKRVHFAYKNAVGTKYITIATRTILKDRV
ncbi:MAG: hypothetical protein UZ22_OP11002001072 [Microgenomates bacterium OLB23]|nr:MAG: hypothetical protein UZ22_OP11002001072 [Microgenomates bacterium OLB23]